MRTFRCWRRVARFPEPPPPPPLLTSPETSVFVSRDTSVLVSRDTLIGLPGDILLVSPATSYWPPGHPIAFLKHPAGLLEHTAGLLEHTAGLLEPLSGLLEHPYLAPGRIFYTTSRTPTLPPDTFYERLVPNEDYPYPGWPAWRMSCEFRYVAAPLSNVIQNSPPGRLLAT